MGLGIDTQYINFVCEVELGGTINTTPISSEGGADRGKAEKG